MKRISLYLYLKHHNIYHYNPLFKEGLKKIVEFSTKGGGQVWLIFHLKEKKNIGLKNWILPNTI